MAPRFGDVDPLGGWLIGLFLFLLSILDMANCCGMLENIYLQRVKSLFCTTSPTNIFTYIYLSLLNFNCVCFVIIETTRSESL